MAEIMRQPMLQANAKTIVDFTIPKTCMFTYDGTAKVQEELTKNVYKGYLSHRRSPGLRLKKILNYSVRTAGR